MNNIHLVSYTDDSGAPHLIALSNAMMRSTNLSQQRMILRLEGLSAGIVKKSSSESNLWISATGLIGLLSVSSVM